MRRTVINSPVCLLLLLTGLLVSSARAQEATPEVRSGLEIMQDVYRRHQQYPYIYEQQSMVMIDKRGRRDTRRARRYSRLDEDGTTRFLLLYDFPEEVRGVALLANRDTQGKTQRYLYLPAFGPQLVESLGDSSDSNFLGTDFSIEDLSGEVLEDYRYVRRQDVHIEGLPYYVIDVYPARDSRNLQQKIKRHYVRKDICYITITDHYNRKAQVSRQLSHHDLRAVDGEMWRANMILVEDKLQNHRSLIKIERRVFSQDYVPAEIFSAEWLFRNYPTPLVMDEEAEPEVSDPAEIELTPDEGIAQ